MILLKTVLYQLAEQSPIQMMSYVVKTSNDKTIVIDGGNIEDGEYLFNFLKDHCSGKPIVDAWFFTHAHCDHINAFVDIMNRHAGELDVKAAYYNFPSEAAISEYKPSEITAFKSFNVVRNRDSSFFHLINSGDEFTYDGVSFKVLQIWDKNETFNLLNNSSSILLMKVENQKILFLGDAGVEAGNRLLNTYGPDNLKCDIVQMAHHGQAGVTKEVYKAINPKVCLWATPLWLWENDAGEGFDTHCFLTVRVRKWMEELGVKHHFIAKDGTCGIEWPYKSCKEAII